MEKVINLLESIRDFEIEKYNAENEFKEVLNQLICEKYNGDFATFMQKEVLNEDYGDLRFEVERLYKC